MRVSIWVGVAGQRVVDALLRTSQMRCTWWHGAGGAKGKGHVTGLARGRLGTVGVDEVDHDDVVRRDGVVQLQELRPSEATMGVFRSHGQKKRWVV